MKLILLPVLVLITLNFSGCGVINTLRMMNANNDIHPVWQKNTAHHAMTAHYIGGKPYLKVIVNSQHELLFLIDSGASFSMLFDTPQAKSVKGESGYALAVGGWGEGDNTEAFKLDVEQLALGETIFDDVSLAFIPVSGSGYYLREDEAIFDGVLGHDIMRHFSWTFDKQNNTITVSSKPADLLEGDIAIPFEINLKKLSIPATATFSQSLSTRRDIIIDTGSRHYVKLSSQFLLDNDISPPATVTAADFGMSGIAEHQRFVLPELALGELVLQQVKANAIHSDDEDDWWIIGSGLMNQFVTILDYHTQQFIIRPYNNHQFATLFNLSGLELRKLRNGNFVVRYISPDFDTAATNLQVGDEVTRINNTPSTALSEESWLNMASQPLHFELCKINGECVTFNTQHIPGYSISK